MVQAAREAGVLDNLREALPSCPPTCSRVADWDPGPPEVVLRQLEAPIVAEWTTQAEHAVARLSREDLTHPPCCSTWLAA